MSDVYRSWQSSYKCLIHYVSAMPSQLYYVTQKFLNKEKFPGGSFHMRHLKLVSSDIYDLMEKMFKFVQHDASQRHKLNVIKNIFHYAPIQRQFIMVGDSGELDPEIYGEIARQYPNRIKMIFIRLVEGGKNNDSRFDTAFKDVPNDKWSLFSNANELPQKLYDDEDPINDDSVNNANILSISFFYNILPILLTLFFLYLNDEYSFS